MQSTVRKLFTILPPKQQTLDFGATNLWRQLPLKDQDACRAALAQLLAFIIQTEVEDQNDE